MLEFGKGDDFASGLELCQIDRSGTGAGGGHSQNSAGCVETGLAWDGGL